MSTQIEFVCDPALHGVIAEPAPAKTYLPEWFRSLATVDKEHITPNHNGMTVKRCLPFLDAMTLGWVLPIAADVRMEVTEQGHGVRTETLFDRVLVSSHLSHQIGGHPRAGRPICKFHNYWTIKTPPGWSCLFVPPLNRAGDAFEIMAGVVDTDIYHSCINFPFMASAVDGVYEIERGTPIAQVIPFRRDGSQIGGSIRAETPEECETRGRIFKATQQTDGWYRDEARAGRAKGER